MQMAMEITTVFYCLRKHQACLKQNKNPHFFYIILMFLIWN